MYILLMIVVRLLGKRMSGQLSNLELAVMVTLGAIVSSPMQTPQRGILAGAVLLIVLLGLQQIIGRVTAVSPGLERVVFGRGTILVKDGELQLKAMRQGCISHEQLFGLLREKDVRHLGEVERLYLEASGTFSLLRRATPQPGLAVVQAEDEKMERAMLRSRDWACSYCGRLESKRPTDHCAACRHNGWVPAAAASDDRRQANKSSDTSQESASNESRHAS
jgi:uncharacterized membrane protein YcaP (DUF421 family)